MDLTAVQQAYDAALRRLLHDLAAETGLTPSIAIDFDDPTNDLPYRYTDDTSFHGNSLMRTDDVDEATAVLADVLQDDVLQSLWGTAWPSCPTHSHPAVPRKVGRIAMWVCPRTGELLCPIGELAERP